MIKENGIKKGDQLKFHKKVTGTNTEKIMVAASDEKRGEHGMLEVMVEGIKSPFLASYLMKVN
jgi:hypothetical protein